MVQWLKGRQPGRPIRIADVKQDPAITVLTQYYPPEPGAAAIRLQAMAREFVRHGFRVTVVTAFPHHLGYHSPAYRGRLVTEEQDGPIRVIRTWIYRAPQGTFVRRLLNYFSFVVSSGWGLARAPRPDYLLIESPPLFLGLTAYAYSRITGVPYILSVSDLWPASAVALGLVRSRLAIGASEWLERFLYRHAYRISAVTEGIRDAVAATGLVPPNHILFAPNGVDPDRFQDAKADPELVRRLDLAGKRVFLYPGTMGYAQGLDIILDAAATLREDPRIVFLLVGEGPVKATLQAEAVRRGLGNVIFEPLQPADRMPYYFGLARAVVVPLRRHRLFAGARPSKAFPAWAAGVPVIFCGEGEMAAVVEASGAGAVVPPEDGPALAAAVRRYAELSDEEVARQAERGRQFVRQHYAWPRIIDAWLKGLRPA